jgi:hypothetical protein
MGALCFYPLGTIYTDILAVFLNTRLSAAESLVTVFSLYHDRQTQMYLISWCKWRSMDFDFGPDPIS